MVQAIKRIVRKVTNRVAMTYTGDASYHEKDWFPSPVPANTPQSKEVLVNFNEKDKKYEIVLGEERLLSNGDVIVVHGNKVFDSRNLVFKGKTVDDVETSLGPGKRTTLSWEIPGAGILLNTCWVDFSGEDHIMFELHFPGGFPDACTGDFGNPAVKFPVFRNDTPNAHVLTFRHGPFSMPIKEIPGHVTAPVLFFDEELNAFIISALQDFGVNPMLVNKANKEKTYHAATISVGPAGTIESIAPGEKLASILVVGKGISATFERWGDLLHRYHETAVRRINPYADLMNSHLGYFTDAGSYYYYNPIPGTTYDETLRRINDYYTNEEPVPFRYFHLDSWWYPKSVPTNWLSSAIAKVTGGGKAGGCVEWRPDPKVWGIDLAELSPMLGGKPLTAHARWFDGSSPYVKRFPMLLENGWAIPTSIDLWNHLMDICNEYNIIVYEQDWMVRMFKHFDYLKNDLHHHARWLQEMHDAAASHGVKIQYCMGTPAQWMESLRLPNVINLRSTGDYHDFFNLPYYMCPFTQNSMFAHALGKWPFLDVFFSTNHSEGKDAFSEQHPKLKALMSTLGGGPVAPGDPIGKVDVTVMGYIARKDGLIYKPDKPLMAHDTMFIPHDTPYIALTTSTHGGFTWYYLVAANMWDREVKTCQVSLEKLGLNGPLVSMDWFTGNCRVLETSADLLDLDIGQDEYRYLVLAPFLTGNVSFVGDAGKFVTASRRQFHGISVDGSTIKIEVEGSKGDNSKLTFAHRTSSLGKILVDGRETQPETRQEVNGNGTGNVNLSVILVEFRENGVKTVVLQTGTT